MIAPFRTVQALAADWIYVQHPAFLAQFHAFLPPSNRQAGKCRSTDTPLFTTRPESATCSASTCQRVPDYSSYPWSRSRVVWAMAKTNERHRPHGFAYAPEKVCTAQVSPFASFSFVLMLITVRSASGVRPDKNFTPSQQPETTDLQSMRENHELKWQEQDQDARGSESSGRRRTRQSKGLGLATSRAYIASEPVDVTKYTSTTVLSSGVRIGNIFSTPVHFGVYLQPTNASSIPVRITHYLCDRTPLGAHGPISPSTDGMDGGNSD